MTQLDYESLDTEPRSPLTAFLIAMPVIAGLLLLYVAGKNAADEPYGIFVWSDAILQVGGSAVVVFIWIAWFMIVLLKRRSVWPLPMSLALGLWGALNCWVAYIFGVGYFGEIWNQ